jgi:toxin-antitoxin system PIN domain toxin
VIVLDANVLVYAYDAECSRHAAARAWLEDTLNGDGQVGLPVTTAVAFLRIVTNASIMRMPMPASEAIDVMRAIATRRNVRLLAPTARHWEVLGSLVEAGRAKGSLFAQAHLAALAIEHGAAVATTDRGFARFPGVKIVDPS